MKKRLNSRELVKSFNELRLANQGKTFTGKELDQLLNRYSFSMDLVLALKRNSNVFDSVRSGTSKLFSFRKDPLFIDTMEHIVKDMRDHRIGEYKKETPNLSEEEKALALLKNQGYQIKKLVGFDESRFKKENPELYKKYLVYEYI